ncbi:NAD(P)-dependent oxidoreductase [Muricauda sp. SCSIO 64092]|uniref:NAD-dependent epimerase/dehydratase family protein n=1 Tax=Allomuricauda sp. SCSIO 64092 TaxID=2908842 RepID=UPI001FF1FA78|nr:NAD(P)-dependent oxidoreductase [Muricauda sp. SCSIO 64092]UOY04919.1 NAD(P)-dependent oxidoreductase [Muricauda sp. SCSIO 64092]
MKILLTGATGKVGQNLLKSIGKLPSEGIIRALCHNRIVEETGQVEVFRGDLTQRISVMEAMQGITHVVHLATTKEDPDSVMDVAVKGLFWLLEECVKSLEFKQFILIGGDASVGHFFYDRGEILETDARMPYPGCYVLSKAMEEDMLACYHIQYGLNTCSLRVPWIMEKDDFKYAMMFGNEQFGGPLWADLIGKEKAEEYAQKNHIPLLLDKAGKPLKRNFIHVSDLIRAISKVWDNPQAHGELFNIAMDGPLDYDEATQYIVSKYGGTSIEIPTNFHSVTLNTAKAGKKLGWTPHYDIKRLVDEAYTYVRDPKRHWQGLVSRARSLGFVDGRNSPY